MTLYIISNRNCILFAFGLVLCTYIIKYCSAEMFEDFYNCFYMLSVVIYRLQFYSPHGQLVKETENKNIII